MAGAIYIISRTTASGWLLVLFSLVVAVLGLGAILPGRGLTGIELNVEAPGDATAGQPVGLAISAEGRVRPCQLRLAEPPGEPVRLDGPCTGVVLVVPRRRGVLNHVDVELGSAAPFGLVRWRRPLRVALHRPLEVGPQPLFCDSPFSPSGPGGSTASGRPAGASGDTVRAVRDYLDGDPLRLVSWQATARHGRLMVKELEAPETTSLTVVVELRGTEDEVEQTAGRAAGLANAALATGVPVVLHTREVSGPRTGAVASTVEVGRRLARAVPGDPAAGPADGSSIVVRVGR